MHAQNSLRPSDAERWVSTPHSSALMKNRSGRDTAPELLLRKSLHRLGVRFRLHQPIGQRLSVDILLPRSKLAVFVDGCFWHGCPAHGRVVASGPNRDVWAEKLRSVKEREKRAERLLAEAGYRVFRAWECAILADPNAVAAQVLCAASGSVSTAKPVPGPIKRRCRKPAENRRDGRWL